MKIPVVFDRMYGHNIFCRLTESVAAGARRLAAAEVPLYQAAELVAETALERTGAKAARGAFAHIPAVQRRVRHEAADSKYS